MFVVRVRIGEETKLGQFILRWVLLPREVGAGIDGLARQPAFDLAPIRVNVVAPGVIDTDLWAGMGEEGVKKFKADHESRMPTGKIVRKIWQRHIFTVPRT